MLGAARTDPAPSGPSGLRQFRAVLGAVSMGTTSSHQHNSETAERSSVGAPSSAGSRPRSALVAGSLFIASTVAFMIAATVLSMTFDWPDILREPADVVLPQFAAGGASLVWTWFAVAWTYAVLAVPILLLPTALARREDAALRVATYLGAASVLLALIGFLRWVFVVPTLADSYTGGDEGTRSAVAAAWTAQHQYGGALLGEHLGQLLAISWSVTVSVIILRSHVMPAWAGWLGLLASALYLVNQGDILATAVSGFPVWDLGGLLGSYLWAAWLLVLGVLLFRRVNGNVPIENSRTLPAEQS
ncbi:DUF4386 domain-containing protein [Kribbella sp. CA-245084]|uniref:DUF4386 domain-containing protein n=1 Tax=Kribbella sp. CA-245084 TaxID=3239940 RepID=UPI003D8CCE50